MSDANTENSEVTQPPWEQKNGPFDEIVKTGE